MKHTIRDSIEQHIQTIERVDPVVNAFTFKSFERARLEADQADQLINAGVPVSPLCGVGYGVKNLFDVQGVTTIAGSKILAQAPAAKSDAVLVERLQKASAIMWIHHGKYPLWAHAQPTPTLMYCRGLFGWIWSERGCGDAAFKSGLRHQWFYPSTRIALRCLGNQAHLWTPLKARNLSLCQ